jgi:tetratricopeptide (TPR) repeat protein
VGFGFAAGGGLIYRSRLVKRSRAAAATPPAPTPRWQPDKWLLALLIVVATVFAYQQAWHAGYIWDDDIYVTTNQLLTAPDGLKRIWFSLDSPSQYFPLVYTTFRLEHALWGLHPAGYHWVNIILHALNALLVWRLLQALQVPGAWLAAAIFALHPVHVESVAWITERKNVLMGLFFLLALLAWQRFVAGEERGRRWAYAAALFCYLLALFSKTTACTMPAALLLMLWLQHRRITWQRVLQVVPFVLLGIVMGLVTIWWERHHQGTQGQLFAIPFADRFLIASRAVWFYLAKLLWPAELAFSYPRWSISIGDPMDYLWVVAIGAAAVVIYLARRRLGRGPEVAAVFFVATLAPMLGFIMLYTFRYSFVADHYQYLASIGPIALAAAGVTLALRRIRSHRAVAAAFSCALVLLPLGLKTRSQAGIYADKETLWRATIATNPSSWMAYNNLAIEQVHHGRVSEAIPLYERALELDPITQRRTTTSPTLSCDSAGSKMRCRAINARSLFSRATRRRM